ncbi:MAG: WD40 repeat domain-containing protein, partial [Planctomycetota bacterium]
SDDRTIRIWDPATGSELLTLKGHESLNAVAFSPDGRQVVSGGDQDGVIRIWGSARPEEVRNASQ